MCELSSSSTKSMTISSIAEDVQLVEMTSPVVDFYDGRHILITGATGFMGKVLLEKLLRSCPGIATIYLLMRPKAGLSIDTRLTKLMESKIFDKVKKDQPNVMCKLVSINGDITLPGLGLNQLDTKVLSESVSIVFHSAATVKFHEPLKTALEMNVLGTRRVLELCRTMNKLECLVYVSSAYSNCNRKEAKEVVYSTPVQPQQLLDAIAWMDNDVLHAITPKLLGNHPNTYTYTKALTERLLEDERGNIPVAIVRPSVVIAAWKEPIPGWVDSLNGITKCVLLGGKGILKSLLGKDSMVVDLVPVDIPINLMITVAWYTATHKHDKLLIYHCTSGNNKALTWRQLLSICNKTFKKSPYTDVFLFPTVHMHSCRTVHKLNIFWYHFFPSYIGDLLSKLFGKNARMIKIQLRLCEELKRVEFYSNSEWQFSSENSNYLLNVMTKEDKRVFNFDIQHMNWANQIENYCLGVKQFILKEDLNSISAAKKQLRRKMFIFVLAKILSVLIMLKMLLSKSVTARKIWEAFIAQAKLLLLLLKTKL